VKPVYLPKLVAAYNFEKGTGNVLYDNSGNYNDGVLINHPDWVAGRHGTGLSFDGVDDVVVAEDLAGYSFSDLSVTFWVKPYSFVSGPSTVAMWGDFWFFPSGDDGWRFLVNGICDLDIPNVFSSGSWVHVAGVIEEGVSCRLYLDGELVGEAPATGAFFSDVPSPDVSPPDLSLTIGASTSTFNFFKGVLDDVRVYDGALTLEKVVSDMNTPIVTEIRPYVPDVSDNVVDDIPDTDSVPTTTGLPDQVNDLNVLATTLNSVTLGFTEVDDGQGNPAKYDVRFAKIPMSWGSATSTVSGTCTTPVKGTSTNSLMACTVNNLDPNTNYDFRLVSFRGTLNVDAKFGKLSNKVSATTKATDSTIGDLNDDGVVDILDVDSVASDVGTSGDVDPSSDVNGDGVVDILDVALVASHCDDCSPPPSDPAPPPPPPPTTVPGDLVNECQNPQPGWIWCDDFEVNRLSSYFEYDNDNGDFVRMGGVGVDSSTAMRAVFQRGEVGAGNLKLAFGRTPQSYFSPVDSGVSDYRDVYWRMYVKNEPVPPQMGAK